jgi:ribosomal protein S18 acetylase RimI-like enzyme
MIIRAIAAEDTERVVDLWRLVFPEYADPTRPQRDPRTNIVRKIAFGDGLFWLAERDDRIAGTVMAGYDGHRGWLYSLAVHPGARRRGMGRALVEHAERALVALGCPKVNLQVGVARPEAQEFWRSLGYEPDAVASFGKRLG